MISAVDINILLDVLIPGAPHAARSEQVLMESSAAGAIIISEPVYAELAARFPTRDESGSLFDGNPHRRAAFRPRGAV